ncbi:MAG: hypothetical protein ACR2GA_06790 [Chloroflexota bacterium]
MESLSDMINAKPNVFEHLVPTDPAYAGLPLLRAFNWAECLKSEPSRHWYVVAFRSIRSTTADAAYLKLLDDLAYEEAMSEPGLLWYFRGTMTERRECLSICVWESQAQAQAATHRTAHRAAADITDAMYDVFELERWLLIKHPVSGELELRPVALDTIEPTPYRRSAQAGPGNVLKDFTEVTSDLHVP